MVVVCQHSPI